MGFQGAYVGEKRRRCSLRVSGEESKNLFREKKLGRSCDSQKKGN